MADACRSSGWGLGRGLCLGGDAPLSCRAHCHAGPQEEEEGRGDETNNNNNNNTIDEHDLFLLVCHDGGDHICIAPVVCCRMASALQRHLPHSAGRMHLGKGGQTTCSGANHVHGSYRFVVDYQDPDKLQQ